MAATAAVALLASMPADARQIDIGVAAAVRPDATGRPPEAEERILAVGIDLFANELIQTDRRGQTHLLFRDGSTLTVGPNSELVLDSFVYDPEASNGELVVTATKGLFRYVGGRISKKRAVLFKTPTAVIGIRGGMAIMQVRTPEEAAREGGAPPVSVTMLYGEEVFVDTPTERRRMTRPGFNMSANSDGSVSEPAPATQNNLNQALKTLEEVPPEQPQEDEPTTESLGDIAPAAGNPVVTDEDVSGSQMAEMGSDKAPETLEAPGSNPTAPTATSTSSEEDRTERKTSTQQNALMTTNLPVADLVDTDTTENRVLETAAPGTLVGIMAVASDPNATDTVTYELAVNPGGNFVIDPVTGKIRVAPGSTLDFEAGQTVNVTARARSSDGTTVERVFSVQLSDDRLEFSVSAPVDGDAAANLVGENSPGGALVGVIAAASDGDASDTVTYALVDNAGGRFVIDPQTGVVSVAPGAALDFETATSHSITVQATSSDASTATQSFLVSLSDDNLEFSISAVSDSNPAADTISESLGNGLALPLTGFASDGDGSDVVQYSLVDDAGGRFAIDPQTGVLTVANSALLDFESTTQHSVTVQATSSDGTTSSRNFLISLTDDRTEFAVSAITDGDAADNLIAETATSGALTGFTAQAEDGDASDGVTFGLTNNSSGRYAIDPVTGVLTFTGGGQLDFNTSQRHLVVVQATSDDGSTSSAQVMVELSSTSFQGRMKRATSAAGTDDFDAAGSNIAFSTSLRAQEGFSASLGGLGSLTFDYPGGAPGSILVTNGSTPYGFTTGTSELSNDGEFVVYKITPTAGQTMLVWAGEPTTTFPTTGVTSYNLDGDFPRNQKFGLIEGPSSSYQLGADGGGTVHIVWDKGDGFERTIGGGRAFIGGQGATQETALFGVTGLVPDDSDGPAGFQHIRALTYGFYRNGSDPVPVFTGAVASSDDGSGHDFFGGTAPDHFVLDGTQVDSADDTVSQGMTRTVDGVSSIYYPNVVASVDLGSSVGASRNAMTLNGYAAGIEQPETGAGPIFRVTTEGGAPNGNTIITDPATHTVQFSFNFTGESLNTVEVDGGSASSNGLSAFIDDDHFGALATNFAYAGENTGGMGVLLSSGYFRSDGFIPSGVSFCACSYLKWGFLSYTRDRFLNVTEQRRGDLIPYVVGELASNAQVNNVPGTQTATYNGHVFTNVANNGAIYNAIGNISLSFTFNPGVFTLDAVVIGKLDGTDYSTGPGVNGSSFGNNGYDHTSLPTTISGTHPTAGAVTATLDGAFFGPGTPPMETAGEVSVTGTNYQAHGVYAATR